jgi:hypothetical protein
MAGLSERLWQAARKDWRPWTVESTVESVWQAQVGVNAHDDAG